MNLLHTFREQEYLWPGFDSAADILGLNEKSELRERVRRYFTELCQAHGKQAVTMTFAIYGNEATHEQLARVEAHFPALAKRAQETPNLLPLFASALRFNRVAADVSPYRAHALKQGLTPAGWRWLSKQSRATVRKLMGRGLTPKVLAWVNLLAKAGEILPARLAEPGCVLGLAQLSDQAMWSILKPQQPEATEALVTFIRLALRTYAGRNTPEARALFMEQYGLLVVEQIRRYRKNTKFVVAGTTWESAVRQMEAALQERLALAAQRQRLIDAEEEQQRRWQSTVWESRVPEHARHGIQVVPLCTHQQLVEEGAILDHCVGNGTYLPLCIQGSSRIFSLRGKQSAFRATLQLSSTEQGEWAIAQLKTFGNSMAPAIFHKVAREVRDAYNQAAR